MKLKFALEVDIDEAEVEKLNGKRKRGGRAARSAADQVDELVSDALKHNFIVDKFKLTPVTE